MRTHEGASYRGTIIESVPGSHVLLMLPNGETRRFTSEQIEAFGTSPIAPPAPVSAPPGEPALTASASMRAAPSVQGERALRFIVSADVPGLTLLLQAHTAAVYTPRGAGVIYGFDRLCTAPCELTLDPGNYRFAVEDARGTARGTSRPTLLTESGRLDIGVESRRTQRIILWVSSLALLGVGAGVYVKGFRGNDDGYGLNLGPTIAGSVLMGLGVGLVCSATLGARDRGRVTFTPGL